MIGVTIKVAGLTEAMQYIERLKERLNDREKGLIQATNRVAAVWERNFRETGSEVGGWAPLAEKTLNMRDYYRLPAGPPLIRYGALKAVVADKFMETTVEARWSMGDSYSDQVTEGRLDIQSDRAILSAHGWKVSNQYGFSNTRGGDVPARPFWFVNRNVQQAARDGVLVWIKEEVI